MRMMLSGAAALALLSLTAAPALAQKSYDGRWSVEVITESGSCDRAYRYAVNIQNGRVSYAGPERFDVTGTVGANGRINGAIARDQYRIQATGQLQERMGQGTWQANVGGCSGRWVADKRG